MSAVWKQPLDLYSTDVSTTIDSSGILHVGLDPEGVPCVWFWAPEEGWSRSHVMLVGTGHDLPKNSVDRYIGSLVYRTLVLHAFEVE